MSPFATQILIEPDVLEQQLGDPALRIFDCTVILEVGPDGLRFHSGRDDWVAAHIPGSDFLDLLGELSDASSGFHFTLPSAEHFSEALSVHGVGNGTRVVLYDNRNSSWAARVWWMLRAYGFDAAAVLNGGWKTWTLQGRPTSSEQPRVSTAHFEARPRPGVFVGKEDVLARLEDPTTCLINGLSEQQHLALVATVPGGRPGHIPGSENVPADTLVDPATKAYLPEPELRALLERAGALNAGRVITYCGGGIAASGVAFALKLLGYDDVAVYDNSLEEWATDPNLPIEVG